MRALAPLALLPVLLPSPAAAHGCHHGERHPHAFERLVQEGLGAEYPGLNGVAGLGGSTLDAAELFAHVCVEGSLEPPAGWVTADGHTHYESCDGILPDPQRMYFDAECLGELFMAPRDVQFSSALLWATGIIDLQPFSFPGMFVSGGNCIQVGDTRVVYRQQWEGSGGAAPGAVDLLSGIASSEPLGYAPFGIPVRERVVQTGIEVSGWDAGYFGHVAALNLGPAGGDLFERFEELDQAVGCAPLFDGDAAEHPELAKKFDFHSYLAQFECGGGTLPFGTGGHRNDGTGNWPGPLLEMFKREDQVVTGYMHQFWPVDTAVSDLDYGPGFGWDWFKELGPQYAADEIVCFPTGMRAAFPDNFEGGNLNWPLFAAADIATGWVDFLEAQDMEVRNSNPNTVPTGYDCPGGFKIACGESDHHRTPPDSWFGMYYKLLTAGVWTGISAGSDGTCDDACVPRTWVRTGNLDGLAPTAAYDEYARCLAAGRVSLATESHHFLDLEVNGVPIGERVDLERAGTVDATVRYSMIPSLLDPDLPGGLFDPDSDFFAADDRVLQIVHDGQVIASVAIAPSDFVNGTATFVLQGLPVERSGWLAARTRSTSAHTGANRIIVADEPIANCLESEYWMIYCDYVQSKIDAYADCQVQSGPDGEALFIPEFLEQYVGCSRAEMQQRLGEARSIFRALRDYALGDPEGVCRSGAKRSSACGDPLTLVVGGEAYLQGGAELRVSSLHAPPEASGLLFVGTAAPGSILQTQEPPYFTPDLATIAVQASRGGYHEVVTDAGLAAVGGLNLQYVWFDPEPCAEEPDYLWTEAVTLSPGGNGQPSVCP